MFQNFWLKQIVGNGKLNILNENIYILFLSHINLKKKYAFNSYNWDMAAGQTVIFLCSGLGNLLLSA